MSVTVLLPGALTPYASGRDSVRVDDACATVAELFAALAARLPALTDRVMTEQGELRQHVNVFVGDESVRGTGGLATAIPHEATITIVPAVSGG